VDSNSREVTVLLSDLRGFTALAEVQSPGVVLDVLNRYLIQMSRIAVANGGTVDKFMGDAVMLVFGAPTPLADNARHAVTCAVQMQLAMDDINRVNAELGFPPLYMGIGINSGRVLAAVIGSELHSEYTVIGNEVNLASRIESFSLRGQVLISEATYARCTGFVSAGAPMDVHVKGKAAPVRLREVQGIPALGLVLPTRDRRKSPRVVVRMPFVYRLVVNKIVLPERFQGVMLDIGYFGLRAELQHDLPDYSDILLDFDLSLIGRHAGNIYAKVRHLKRHGGRAHAGIEFTSVDQQVEQDLRFFVQLLIQGSPLN
jgi:adenylate cyclase